VLNCGIFGRKASIFSSAQADCPTAIKHSIDGAIEYVQVKCQALLEFLQRYKVDHGKLLLYGGIKVAIKSLGKT
jgi:hypothetical protein